MKRLKIEALAKSVPEMRVSNDDLAEFIETSDEWISQRTGIKIRRVSLFDNTSDLCAKAAKELLSKTSTEASEIDLIIVATMTPDSATPSTAAIVQGKIGAKNAVAFDISAACSGFVYALVTAASMLDSKHAKKALVIGGEVLSKSLDWSDRTTCVLFGDGAAGALIDCDFDGDSALLGYSLKSFGEDSDKLSCQKTLPLAKFPPESNKKTATPFEMDGRAVYNFTTKIVPTVIKAAVEDSGLGLDQIDRFVLHQANARIIKVIARKLHQPLEKFPENISEYGNTSGASIPLLLSELSEQKELVRGETMLLCGFGGGLCAGACVIRY